MSVLQKGDQRMEKLDYDCPQMTTAAYNSDQDGSNLVHYHVCLGQIARSIGQNVESVYCKSNLGKECPFIHQGPNGAEARLLADKIDSQYSKP